MDKHFDFGDAPHCQHHGRSRIFNICFDVKYVVHQIGDAIRNHEPDLKVVEIIVDDIEVRDSDGLHASVYPMELLVVVAANLKRSRTNNVAVNILVVNHDQGLARLDSVLDHVLIAARVLAK
jgi:hypothetical protein